VPFLDGWVILDGHDRAMAAPAQGRTPRCVVLTRLRDEEQWRWEAEAMTDNHRPRTQRPAARPATPATERQRAILERPHGDALAGLPYEPSDLRSWPLPGGAPARSALARATMLQFPGD
jgi:hypothetical protein